MLAKSDGDNYTESQATRLWSYINDSDWVHEVGVRTPVRKGQIVAASGDMPNYCYFVLKGRIMAYECTMSGQERIYNFMEAGSFLMEEFMFVRKPSPVSFIALTPTILMRIYRDDLLKKIFSEPEVAIDVLSSLSYKFLEAMEQIRETSLSDAFSKVCGLLLSFADRYGVAYDGKLLIQEKISQQMMANVLGLNRITLVRIIKKLQDLNLVEQINGYYCIRSAQKLKEYMD